MRVTETIETSAGPVTVRELTVGEIRQWLAGLATRAEARVDVVDEMLFEGFSLADLPLFIGAAGPDPGSSPGQELTQSEARTVIDAAKRLNPDFFHLRDRLGTLGRQALAPAEPLPPSSAPHSG